MEDEITLFAPSKKRSQTVADKSQGAVAVTEPARVVGQGATFEELGLDPWQVSTLQGLGITVPTSVQVGCIPAILGGNDCMGASKTGSGKTAAFALPILRELGREPYGCFALVLTPTRELAVQIAEQFKVFGRSITLTLSLCIGGLDMMQQALELARRPHIVVGTPGRVADLLLSGNVRMDRLRFLVFDEADRLLAPGASFMQREIPTIMARVDNAASRWLFFSATMTGYVGDFYQQWQKGRPSPFHFDGNSEFGTVDSLDQRFLLVPSQARDAYLVQLMRTDLAGKTIIIFVGKCRTAELLVRMFKELAIETVTLHGKMAQRERLRALAKFKSGTVSRLITTDVGSRGLDIPSVQVVLNFDLPADARDYVHRVGRVARAGRPGMALSFVQEIDLELLKSIEQAVAKKLRPYEPAPPESNVLALLNKVSAAKRAAIMHLHDKKFGIQAENNKKKWTQS